jgi:multiple sugar transport system substrate-binding protein
VLFRGSKHKAAAWKLIEFLSLPETQQRFYELSGDLPALSVVWDQPAFQDDPRLAAFGKQLTHVVSTPKIPEWEQIAVTIQEHAEMAVRGGVDPDTALVRLDRRVDRILEKRRWLYERGKVTGAPAPGTPATGGAEGGEPLSEGGLAAESEGSDRPVQRAEDR